MYKPKDTGFYWVRLEHGWTIAYNSGSSLGAWHTFEPEKKDKLLFLDEDEIVEIGDKIGRKVY